MMATNVTNNSEPNDAAADEDKAAIDDQVNDIADIISGLMATDASVAVPAGAGESGEEGTTTLSSEIILSEEDDLKAALEWIRTTDTFGAKALARKLPRSTDRLRRGEIEPDAFMEAVGELYVVGVEIKKCSDAAAALMMGTMDPSWLDTPQKHSWWCEESKKVHDQLTRQMHCAFNHYGSDDDSDEKLYALVHRLLKETCRKYASRIDSFIFPGQRPGFYLARCPVYRIPPDRFAHFVGTLEGTNALKEAKDACLSADSRLKNLNAAVKNLSDGVLEACRTCWQCSGANIDYLELQRCSRCRVALYCSRDCQVAAWHEGHKRKCDALAEKHSAFVESLAEVDAALARGTIDGGALRVNGHHDYILCARNCQLSILPEHLESLLGCPHMKFFYENLSRVCRGDFWFFEANESPSLKDYRRRMNRASSEIIGVEFAFFPLLAGLLSFDLFRGSDSVDSRVRRQLITAYGSPVQQFKRELGMAMPAERFWELYENYSPNNKFLDMKADRRQIKSRCFLGFRDEWHK